MKKNPENWRKLTITTLANRDFGNPDTAPTGLTKRCLKLCRVPVGQFTAADLRLMISQHFVPHYLVPLALELLREDILLESNIYQGDLLESILKLDQCFWQENEVLQQELTVLITRYSKEISLAGFSIPLFIKQV